MLKLKKKKITRSKTILMYGFTKITSNNYLHRQRIILLYSPLVFSSLIVVEIGKLPTRQRILYY